MKSWEITLTYFIISTSILFGQIDDKYDLTRYSIEDGLISNQIYDIVEDDNGLLWMINSRSVIKFDGWRSYKAYTFSDEVANSSRLFLEGNLLYIYSFDEAYRDWKIKPLKTIRIINTVNGKVVNLLNESKTNSENLFLINIEEEIIIYNKDGEQFEVNESLEVTAKKNKTKSISDHLKLDLTKNEFEFLIHYKLSSNKVVDFKSANNGTYYILQDDNNDNYCIYLNNLNQSIDTISFFDNQIIREASNISLGGNQIVTYFNSGSELDIRWKDVSQNIDISTEKILYPIIQSFSLNKILFSNNIIYLATSRGLFILKPKVITKFISTNSKESTSFRALKQISKTKVLAASYSGFKIYDIKTNSIKDFYDFELKDKTGLTITNYNDDEILLGLADRNIIKYNYKNKSYSIVKTPPRVGERVNYGVALTQHNDEILFSSSKYLFRLDEYFNASIYPGMKEVGDLMTIKMAVSLDSLFLCTSKGLWIFDDSKQKFNNRFENYVVNTITKEIGYKDRYWISTNSGIIIWDSKNDTFQKLTTQNLLSSNIITDFIQDENGYMWCPSFRGLMQINIETNKCFVYFEEDGISNNEFNFFSKATLEDGSFLLGTIDGLTKFHPNDFKNPDLSNADIVIQSAFFNKKNKRIDITDQINNEECFNIPFDISSTELSIFNKNQYALNDKSIRYSMRRINDDEYTWTELESNKLLLYNQPSGIYELKIQTSSENARWDEAATYKIKFLKPYYLHPLFIFSGLLCLSFFFYILHKLRVRKMTRDKEYLEKEIEKRTIELSNSNKSKDKLFAIIAHDLRNPLTSLQNITEKFQFLARKNETSRIEDLARYTEEKINVINDNLDNVLNWALTEQGLIRLEPAQIHVKKHIADLKLLFKESLDRKNISIEDNTHEFDRIFFDLTSFQTVLRNILSNAISYAPNNSTIVISSTSNKKDLTLSIFNHNENSIINKNEVIVTRPKFIENDNKHMGLGLSIVKELMHLNKSKIEIESKFETGTYVHLYLPIEHNA